MSTTFAINKKGIPLKMVDGEIDKEYLAFDDMVNVAFRNNYGSIMFTNEIAHLLPSDTMVYAIDNSQQGIYTIGDILESKEYDDRIVFIND